MMEDDAMTIAVMRKLEEPSLAAALLETSDELPSAGGEILLDFSAVRRLDSRSLAALQSLATLADAKAATIVLRGLTVEIYKVLTLMKLTPHFSFVD